MEKLTVLSLLNKYQTWVRNGDIQFLPKASEAQKTILDLLAELIPDFELAGAQEGGLSKNLDWYKTHAKGRKLWQELVSASLNSIDPDSKGNSTLFDYLEKATLFEDVLYGLEEYYRDHTLHSIWVYLIGEYMLRDHLSDVRSNLNWYLYNDFESEKASYKRDLMRYARKKEQDIRAQVNEKQDAVWCIMALCHDLGYSPAKLNKINDRVRDVLKFFDLPEFKQVGYSLDLEQQFLVSQVLEMMAMDVRIVPSENYRDPEVDTDEKVKIRGYRDDATYWRLCRALEKRQHGILSSYLLYKLVGLFAESWVRGTGEEWGLEDSEVVENIIRGDILFAIAQHEFDYAHMNQVGSLAEILFIADELEEFSRYGRQLLSREYSDTTAETAIEFTPQNPKQGEDVEINILYDYDTSRGLADYFNFFWRKAQRLCTVYSLDLEKGSERYCTINRVKITVARERHEFFFELRKGAENKNKGFLPRTKIGPVDYEEGEYLLSCTDDRIDVLTKNGKVNLKDWCKDADKQYSSAS
ncbi:MAG: hypothetical protein HN919_03110 [Verrucomicrobia bacterium]|jgi:hypothetical protein|nr:hypothetical protein [Verrucomicrobiota bacterium]MBT7065266.1 hypothetical protein [Verrucomicrobiota bacterium]MBT7700193.1 hypothetical protein [Verrucomicrobiota bacterium]